MESGFGNKFGEQLKGLFGGAGDTDAQGQDTVKRRLVESGDYNINFDQFLLPPERDEHVLEQKMT